jgi:hypothetical protein
MSSFSDWLKASWGDFRRRWAVLLAVAGAGGGAALVAGFLPFVPAGLATAFGVGPAWAVWGAAVVVSACAILWLSTWAQAAMLRAALTGDSTRECLTRAWGQTAGFARVLCLVVLAVTGGYFVFIVPGLILSVLLFAAPLSQILGEADGVRALGLSWARVKPHFGAVALRLFVAGAVTAAPGYIPYVGWIIMMFWAPFSFIALARLELDLRAAEPDAAPPEWMGRAVAGLSAVAFAGCLASCLIMAWASRAAYREVTRPGGYASRVRPETAKALLDAFARQAPDEEKNKIYADLLAQLQSSPEAPAGAAPVVSSSETTPSPAAASP